MENRLTLQAVDYANASTALTVAAVAAPMVPRMLALNNFGSSLAAPAPCCSLRSATATPRLRWIQLTLIGLVGFRGASALAASIPAYKLDLLSVTDCN
jgi:hypothetical protein